MFGVIMLVKDLKKLLDKFPDEMDSLPIIAGICHDAIYTENDRNEYEEGKRKANYNLNSYPIGSKKYISFNQGVASVLNLSND